MRLSTAQIYDQQMRGISSSQASWLKVGEQLSSGKRVVNPSDDPVAAAQAVVLSQAQAQTSQYSTARGFATNNISQEETNLQQVTSVVQQAQTIVVAAANGTLSDDDRASYAQQLTGIRDQLLNLANTTDGNGRYMFAGYQTDKAPFTQDANGDVTYVGGDTPISQKVDSNRTMVTNHTGSQVFTSLTSNPTAEPDGSASESNIFTTLNTAIKALNTPLESADQATSDAASAALDKTNRGLKNSLNNVLAVRSVLGTQLTELDNLDSKGDDTKVNQATQMSNLVDVDYTSAISSYTMQQTALQASYKVFTDMSSMSLFKM
ncbi:MULTISPECIES: flagellar hook-associated protein FlgL [Erwinia]|uniref:Hook-filament junction protein n=1 Tax=Erwinia billingiae (strain Eb661) TaxID=634500 RepID=D8MQS0_ERWBE|nr:MULTISPECIES: flagellar hook-associated protein FlgL [Erwinia]MBN7121856.1 flagellar hook-filament junction protein FlgL [Erwinia billingiae]MCX0499820.1 flagellar hook-filament junction protein FlgL [Erwinia billingiae]PRB62721.1 flagellar hook-filament junction protein FlgL [Erwinia billingiae]QBR52940.1 flagellar hook-filament junction protein FlgL [Erwinia sp. QL-Z3]CAX59177.1 Hook-filament junction protein [Erwinia billingiae Eb661]